MILRLTGLLGIAALFNTLFNTFFVAGILSVSETTSAPPKNSPPVVEILAPKNNSVHPINTLIRYAVSVADKEDGESRFDEIPRDQIFLKIRFVEGYPGRPTGLEARNLPEAAGLSQLKKSDCFSCHHFRDKLIGPSFAEIASRYA